MSDKHNHNENMVDAIHLLAKSIRLLGNGNIERGDESPGAIEGLKQEIKETSAKQTEALYDIADAIRELAQAVSGTKET